MSLWYTPTSKDEEGEEGEGGMAAATGVRGGGRQTCCVTRIASDAVSHCSTICLHASL